MAEKLIAAAVRLTPRGRLRNPARHPTRILVLKFGGLGEAVLARSLMDGLLERNPDMTIDYLVEDRTAEVMTLGRSGISVYQYSPSGDGLGAAARALMAVRRNRYDAVVDFEQHSLLTASFCRGTSIPIRIGFVPSFSNHRDRMFTHPIQLIEGESMWSAFIRLGRVLDPELPRALSTTPLPSSESAERWLEEWWATNVGRDMSGPVIAMHPGVGPSAQYRRWPISRFAECAAALAAKYPGLIVLLTGAGGERLLMREFQDAYMGKAVEAADLGGLERTCALLRRCDLLLSADTGMMHLAAAMGVPTVGLFGPNTPACWAPVGERATYVYTTRQSCSPCINSYRRQIPGRCTAARESSCMWDIRVEDVLCAAGTVMRG